MQPTVNQSVIKRYDERCLIGLQKGVSKGLKGHLLQANWAYLEAKRACVQNYDVKNYDRIISY